MWQAIRAVDTSKTKLKWVKGHADDRKKPQACTAEETRNIEMDKEAEKHYADEETVKPWRHTADPLK